MSDVWVASPHAWQRFGDEAGGEERLGDRVVQVTRQTLALL